MTLAVGCVQDPAAGVQTAEPRSVERFRIDCEHKERPIGCRCSQRAHLIPSFSHAPYKRDSGRKRRIELPQGVPAQGHCTSIWSRCMVKQLICHEMNSYNQLCLELYGVTSWGSFPPELPCKHKQIKNKQKKHRAHWEGCISCIIYWKPSSCH